MVLGFSSTGFCNISGGPSKIPTTPAHWAVRLVAWQGWMEQRNPEMNKEAGHLMVFQVLFQTGVSPLPMAKPWRTNSPGKGKVPGPVPRQEPTPTVRRGEWSPPWAPRKGEQLRKPGYSGEGSIVIDSVWLWVCDCWLKGVREKKIFLKLQSQFFLPMQFKTTSLIKALPRKKLELNPFHVLEIHSPVCLRRQPWAN